VNIVATGGRLDYCISWIFQGGRLEILHVIFSSRIWGILVISDSTSYHIFFFLTFFLIVRRVSSPMGSYGFIMFISSLDVPLL